MGIEECVRRESKSLHGYLIESREWMLHAALKERVMLKKTFRTISGGKMKRKLGTGRRNFYMESFSNKYLT